MTKDVLLVRSNKYHLAVPTEHLLEIVNLDEYHMQQQKSLDTTTLTHKIDKFRLWRNHLLPVVHLGQFLEPRTKKQDCPYGLVYQASDHETLYLDTDHVFGITHVDISKMKPVYASDKEDQMHASTLNLVQSKKNILAYVFEESNIHNS
jgi:chemotaxis protein histidine kinase CheA